MASHRYPKSSASALVSSPDTNLSHNFHSKHFFESSQTAQLVVEDKENMARSQSSILSKVDPLQTKSFSKIEGSTSSQMQFKTSNPSFSESYFAPYSETMASPRSSFLNPTSLVTLKSSLDQFPSVRAIRFDTESENKHLAGSITLLSNSQNLQPKYSQQDPRGSTTSSIKANEPFEIVKKFNCSNIEAQSLSSGTVPFSRPSQMQLAPESGSPSKKACMSDISIKILNEIINSPSKMLKHTGNAKSQLPFQPAPYAKSRSPVQRSQQPFPLSQSLTPLNEVERLKKDYQSVKAELNNEHPSDHLMELSAIESKIQEYSYLIELKKSEMEFITSKIQSQLNASKINQIIEAALIQKCSENKKKLEQIAMIQRQEQEEFAIQDGQSERLKTSLSESQQKLEIIKQHESRILHLREKKIVEANQEFQKKTQSLEDLIEQVSQQQNIFSENLSKLEEQYHINLETKAFLKEDLNGKLIQRAELVAEKEELEEILQQFDQQYNEESSYQGEVQRIDATIQEISQQLEQYKSDERKFQATKVSIQSKLQDKESYLCHYSSKLGDLSALIAREKEHSAKLLEVSQVSLQISSEQFQFLPDLEHICIQFLQSMTKRFDQTQGPAIQQTVRVLRTSQRSATNTNTESKDSVGILVNHIQASYFNRIEINSQVSDFLQSLRNLFTSLVDLEDINDRYFYEEQEIVSQIERLNVEVESLKGEFNSLNSRIEYTQLQIANDSDMLRKTQQSKLVMTENLKVPVKKHAEVIFMQYCEQQKEHFDHIASVHGIQQVEHLMQDHKEQFFHLMSIQQSERMKRMDQIRTTKDRLEINVRDNIDLVEQDILPRLKNLVAEIQELQQNLERSRSDFKTYTTNTESVHNDLHLLQNCLQQKIQEIDSNFKVQLVDLGGRIANIQEEINSELDFYRESEGVIERIQSSIQSLRKQELEIVEDTKKAVEKKRLMENIRQQTTTVQHETSRRELEIVELEKKIAQLQVSKLVLENQETFQIRSPSQIRVSSPQPFNAFDFNLNSQRQQNQKQSSIPSNPHLNSIQQTSSNRNTTLFNTTHRGSVITSYNNQQQNNVPQQASTRYSNPSVMMLTAISDNRNLSKNTQQRNSPQPRNATPNQFEASPKSKRQLATNQPPCTSRTGQLADSSPLQRNGFVSSSSIRKSLISNGNSTTTNTLTTTANNNSNRNQRIDTAHQNTGFPMGQSVRSPQQKSSFGSPKELAKGMSTCRSSFNPITAVFHPGSCLSSSIQKFPNQNSPKARQHWKS